LPHLKVRPNPCVFPWKRLPSLVSKPLILHAELPRVPSQAHLDRINAYDKRGPLINALITVNLHALEEADRLDGLLKATGKLARPLHGIPVIVKDNIDVAGLPMTSGFQGWKNYYPPADAPLVTKLRAAGGIILAKSSLSEFAYGIADNVNSVVSGFARNPYNTAFATGGSSGGSAAAVAASFGIVAIGTDTGGRCACRPHTTHWPGFARPSDLSRERGWCPSTQCEIQPAPSPAPSSTWRSCLTSSPDLIPKTVLRHAPPAIVYKPIRQA